MSYAGSLVGVATAWSTYLFIKVCLCNLRPGNSDGDANACVCTGMTALHVKIVADNNHRGIVQRDISRGTAQTTAAIHGQKLDTRSPELKPETQLVDASRLALHAQVALTSSWNQAVDTVFNPVIRELHRRGW